MESKSVRISFLMMDGLDGVDGNVTVIVIDGDLLFLSGKRGSHGTYVHM
jgi:hypothetical protein